MGQSHGCQKPSKILTLLGVGLSAILQSACNEPGTTTANSPTEQDLTEIQRAQTTSQALTSAATSGDSSSSSSRPGGPIAAKIIFKKGNPGGSFTEGPVAGTPALPGSGLQAVRVFNADGSLLASGGPTSEAWPKWLTGVEIGISGSNNDSAPNAHCARFSKSGEQSGYDCDPDGIGGDDKDCGAPTGWYRVSEADCTKLGATTTGNGGPYDGVYIRTTFSRNPNYLGTNENIQAILEYSSSMIHSGPTNPSDCFQNGVFNYQNKNCADQVWQIYLKHNLYEVVQPFLMLTPGPTSLVNGTQNLPGGSVGTKQWIIPLARDTDLSVLQISRIIALDNENANFETICNSDDSDSDGANTAHCVGMVFYTLTLIRI